MIKKCNCSNNLLWVGELSDCNSPRKGWDVLKSGNTRLRKRTVYEKVESGE